MTGVCDGDVMIIDNNKTSLELCGWNSGQHGEYRPYQLFHELGNRGFRSTAESSSLKFDLWVCGIPRARVRTFFRAI